MAKPIRILHLSDLHVGLEKSEYIRHRLWENDERVQNEQTFLEAKSRFADVFSQKIGINAKIDYIVVTGDFVIDGKNEFEHKKAFEILKEFCDKINFNKSENIFIIPGNHDLNREKVNTEQYNEVMTFHKQHANGFYQGFSSNNLDRLYLDDFYEETLDHNNISYRNKQKPYFNNEQFLSFIPLQTQFASSKYIFNSFNKFESFYNSYYTLTLKEDKSDSIVQIEKMKFLWDNFDRGFLSNKQLQNVQPSENSRINIALMHHNPLPILRESNSFGGTQYCFPESSYLSNGPEVIEELMSKNINIILCGHRHQNYMFKFTNNQDKECLIIAAPSCGESSDILGYNYIEITPEEFSTKVNISSNILQLTNKWKNSTMVFSLKNYSSQSPFLNFNEGVSKLFNTVLDDSSEEHTMLHYYYKTDWDDYYEKILQNLITDDSLLNAFVQLDKNNDTDKNHIKTEVTNTITDGCLSMELIDFFTKTCFISRLRTVLFGENNIADKNNAFFKFLSNMWKNNGEARHVNYFMENVRCAIEERTKFSIHKCIYFLTHPNNNQKQGVQNKFEWMVKSIVAAKNAKNNYDFSWLPFNIDGLNGESLIEIKNKNASQILFGFSKENQQEFKTVLFIDQSTINMDGGLIIDNVKSLARKIIRPLSRYVLECFPFYKEGILYIDNIQYVAQKLNISQWKKYEFLLNKHFSTKIKQNNRNIEEDLRALNHWLWCILQYEHNSNNLNNELIKALVPWKNNDIQQIVANTQK